MIPSAVIGSAVCYRLDDCSITLNTAFMAIKEMIETMVVDFATIRRQARL